jgi:hypothetical protein
MTEVSHEQHMSVQVLFCQPLWRSSGRAWGQWLPKLTVSGVSGRDETGGTCETSYQPVDLLVPVWRDCAQVLAGCVRARPTGVELKEWQS